MADRDQIEAIKERLDILSVLQEYIPQVKKSGRNYFGLCPFHNEKTPSFSINPDMGMYKCFGCGESGDVITFLQKIEGLDFPHALELAAKRAGVQLKDFQDERYQEYQKKKRSALEAYRLTTEYYQYLLHKHKSGEPARKYLEHRKLQEETVRKFQLGYAPSGYHNLQNFLHKKGYTDSQLVEWGLLVHKNGRSYDKFRQRLMFPISDHQGEVIAFSGRKLSEDEFGPKYLNSPETIIYKKSNVLYGLYQAKQEMRKQNFAILVEGNVDPLTSHQVGIENIVAPLGTALTTEQLEIIKRYSEQIYFAFDTDQAGMRALLRSLELAERVGIGSKVIDIGTAQDADEFIVQGGDWKGAVKKAQPVVDYLMEKLQHKYDLDNSKQKLTYCREILRFIVKVANDLEKDDYLEKLSFKVKLEKDRLREEMSKLKPLNATVPPSGKQEKNPEPKDLIDQFNEESYLAAILVQHMDWLQGLEKIENFEFIAEPEIQEIIELLFRSKLKNVREHRLYRDLNMRQIDPFVSEHEFIYEVNAVVQRIKKKFIQKRIRQLGYEPMTEDNLRKITKYTEELAKVS